MILLLILMVDDGVSWIWWYFRVDNMLQFLLLMLMVDDGVSWIWWVGMFDERRCVFSFLECWSKWKHVRWFRNFFCLKWIYLLKMNTDRWMRWIYTCHYLKYFGRRNFRKTLFYIVSRFYLLKFEINIQFSLVT